MKKWIYVMCSVVMCVSMLAGCSSDNQTGNDVAHTVTTLADGKQVNDAFNAEMMTTLDGTSFLLHVSNDWFIEPEMGFGVTNTEPILQGLQNGQVGGNVTSPYALTLFYIPAEITEKLKQTETMTPEEQDALFAKLQEQTFFFTGVCRVPKNDKEAEVVFAEFSDIYEKTEKIVDAFDSTYYLGYNDNIQDINWNETDKQALQTIIDDREKFKNKLFIYPPSDAADMGNNTAIHFQQFETQTLTGETVTADIFKDYDLTVVNVWATWCSPCVSEIPELVELDKTLPQNVNVISISIDGESEKELVQEMVDHFGIEYPVLMPSESLQNSVLGYVSSLPTTFFVDKEGNLVGEPVIGVPGRSGEILEAYQNQINTRLESIQK